MCDDCKCKDNHLKLLACVVEYLHPLNPELWLRSVYGVDETIADSVSRSVTDSEGYVLAIWNGAGKGWRLRQSAAEGNDFPVDPSDKRFTELTEEMLFQLDMFKF